MMGRWVVFGKIISHIEASWGPVEIELELRDAILEPVVAHIESLRAFHADLNFEDVVGCRIVGLEGSPSGWLFVAHLFKGSDDRYGFLAVEKEPPVSASAAEAGTPRMVLQRTWTAPLGLGVGGSVVGRSVRK
jgi:hypothetical protein